MGHVSKLRNTSALSVSYYYTERTFFFSPIFSVITGHPPSIARSQQLARLHVSNTTIWISQAPALTGVTVFTQRLLSQGCESHRQLLPPGSSPSFTPCWSSSSQPQQPCFFLLTYFPLSSLRARPDQIPTASSILMQSPANHSGQTLRRLVLPAQRNMRTLPIGPLTLSGATELIQLPNLKILIYMKSLCSHSHVTYFSLQLYFNIQHERIASHTLWVFQSIFVVANCSEPADF